MTNENSNKTVIIQIPIDKEYYDKLREIKGTKISWANWLIREFIIDKH
jgi:hypothetical protein